MKKQITIIAMLGIAILVFFAGCGSGDEVPPGIPAGFVLIPGGTFTMGSPPDETDRYVNEGPQHEVTVSSFYMAKYEVTQKEIFDEMGGWPGNGEPFSQRGKGDDYPIYLISWYHAVDYCNRRSLREGMTPAYTIDKVNKDPNNPAIDRDDPLKWTVTMNQGATGYRLPTEAEWEYACRAGTTTAFNTGETIKATETNFYNFETMTRPGWEYPPNAWGLYGMHGNVSEWCWDWYEAYTETAQVNPTGAVSANGRVYRGGGFAASPKDVRSAVRRTYPPVTQHDVQLGFRVVRNL
jgi:formylglycine-generating enzyme required for sulfatase activity